MTIFTNFLSEIFFLIILSPCSYIKVYLVNFLYLPGGRVENWIQMYREHYTAIGIGAGNLNVKNQLYYKQLCKAWYLNQVIKLNKKHKLKNIT